MQRFDNSVARTDLQDRTEPGGGAGTPDESRFLVVWREVDVLLIPRLVRS
jgi:hypothetical protein